MLQGGTEQQIAVYTAGLYVCLAILIAALAAAAFFFFRFRITKVIAVMSGRQRKKTVARMKGKNRMKNHQTGMTGRIFAAAAVILLGAGLWFAAPAFAGEEAREDVSAETVRETEYTVRVVREDPEESRYHIEIQTDGGSAEECAQYDKGAGTVTFRGLTLGGIAFPEASGTEETSIVRVGIDGNRLAEKIRAGLPLFANKEDRLALEEITVTEPVSGLSFQYELKEGPVVLQESDGKQWLVSDSVATETPPSAIISAKACGAEGEVCAETKIVIPLTAPTAETPAFLSGVEEAGGRYYALSSDPAVTLSCTGDGVSAYTVQSEGDVTIEDSSITIQYKELPEGEQTITVCGQAVSFLVDTRPPEIRTAAVPDPVNESSGVQYYDGRLTCTFTAFDPGLAKIALAWSSRDIETGQDLEESLLWERSAEEKTPSEEQTVSFTIPDGQMLTGYSVTAWDQAGLLLESRTDSADRTLLSGHRTEKKEDHLCRIVDETAPAVRITQSRTRPEGTEGSTDYYSQVVVFDMEIYDLNLDPGLSKLTLHLNGGNTVLAFSPKGEQLKDRFTWTASFTLDDTAGDPAQPGDLLDGISGLVTDLAGNGAVRITDETKEEFSVKEGKISSGKNAQRICVDRTAPAVQITAPARSESGNSIGNLYYYRKDQAFLVKITDAHLDPARSKISYVLTQNGKSKKRSIACSKLSLSREKEAWIVEIPVTDAQELSGFKVLAKDHAGHAVSDSSAGAGRFLVDTTAPLVRINVSGPGVESFFTNGTDVYVKFKEAAEDCGSGTDGTVQRVMLKASVTDRNIETDTSGKYRNRYFVTNDYQNGIRWKGSCKENSSSTVTYKQSMTVKPGTSGDICFRITVKDLAGNAAKGFETDTLPDPAAAKISRNSKGTISGKVIADRMCPTSAEGENTAPVITLTPGTSGIGLPDEGVILYSGSVNYDLATADPVCTDSRGGIQYSGLASVSWTVESGKEGLITTSGNENLFSGDRSAKLTIPVLINGTGETNDITVKVTVTDRAGNTTFCEQKLAIDNEKPRVTVSYDNQDARNERYFKDARTATITVEDLNFDADRTSLITGGSVSGWSRSGNGWTAEVTCAEDGDYTFEMAAEDKAGNRADIDYSNHGANAAAQDFTIDKTRPVIRIAYDNNKARNGKYFNRGRTATVTVEEQHFNGADVITVVERCLDGEQQAAPDAGTDWSDNGDLHSTEIVFSEDGDYSGTIRYTDPAGNEAEALILEAFTVDTTPPEVRLTGVKNEEARKDAVTPQLRFSDRNFDEKNWSCSWTRTDRLTQTGDLLTEHPPAREDLLHGEILYGLELGFEDPDPSDPGNDGICRLNASATDLAGNTACLTDERGRPYPDGVIYSLNRFGSVYDLPEDAGETKELLKNGCTNTAPALSIRETNPDALKNQQITVAVNGSIRTLAEGSDYEIIPVRGEDTEWKQYLYRLFESAFTDGSGKLVQGEYHITLYSEDDAGNLNSNRTNIGKNSLEIAFVADNEPPDGYINVAGLTEGSDSIQADSTGVSFFWEDNYGVKQVDLYLNGEAAQRLTGDALAAAAGTAVLEVKESTERQSAFAVITDVAGNQTTLKETGFYLNSSGLRIFMKNKSVLIGAVSGIAAAAAAGVLILSLRVKRGRKRKHQKQRPDRGQS